MDSTDYTKWDNISADKDYQNLDMPGQEAVRKKYIATYVKPEADKLNDPNVVKGFLSKSIDTDIANGAIKDEGDASDRMEYHGLAEKSNMSPSAIIGGAARGVANAGADIGTGLLQATITGEKLIGGLPKELEQPLYDLSNKYLEDFKNENTKNSSNKTATKIGEVGTKIGSALALAPEEGVMNMATLLGLTNMVTEPTSTPMEKATNLPANIALNAAVGGTAKLVGNIIPEVNSAKNRLVKPGVGNTAQEQEVSRQMEEINKGFGSSNAKQAESIADAQMINDNIAPNAKPSVAQLSGGAPSMQAIQNSVSQPTKLALDIQEMKASKEASKQFQSLTTAPQGTEQALQTGISVDKAAADKTLEDINQSIAKSGSTQAKVNEELVGANTAHTASSNVQTGTAYSKNAELNKVAEDYNSNTTMPYLRADITPTQKEALGRLAGVDKASKQIVEDLGFKYDAESGTLLENRGAKAPTVEDVQDAITALSSVQKGGGVKNAHINELKQLAAGLQGKVNEAIIDPNTGLHKAFTPDTINEFMTKIGQPNTPENVAAIMNPTENYGKTLTETGAQREIAKPPIDNTNAAKTSTTFVGEPNTKPYTVDTIKGMLQDIIDDRIKSSEIPALVSEHLGVGVKGAQATKDWVSGLEGQSDKLGQAVQINILKSARDGDVFNPEKAKTLLNDEHIGYAGHLDALPAAEKQTVFNNVNTAIDAASKSKQAGDVYSKFADFIANPKLDSVITNAVKDEESTIKMLDSLKELNPANYENAKALMLQKYSDSEQVLKETSANIPEAYRAAGVTSELKPTVEFINKFSSDNPDKAAIFNLLKPTDAAAKANLEDATNLMVKYAKKTVDASIGSDKKNEALKDIAKGIFFHLGGRLGTISNAEGAIKFLMSKGYQEIFDKMAQDPEYTKKILQMFNGKNPSLFRDIMSNYRATMGATESLKHSEPNIEGKFNEAPTTPTTEPNAMVPESYVEPQKKSDITTESKFTPASNETIIPKDYTEPTKPTNNASNDVETIGKNATIARTLPIEGGYVNNPADKGGPTNMGITLATLKAVKPNATIKDIKNLTKEQAIEVYSKEFWDKFNISQFPIDVQDVAFDTYVQHSPITAGKLLQQAVNKTGQFNVPVDGNIGPKTLEAIKAINGTVLRQNLLDVRENYYRTKAQNNPSQAQFLKGWLNRVEAIS